MAKVLLVTGNGNLVSVGQATTRYFVCANAGIKEEATEADAQITYHAGGASPCGVSSNLYVRVTGNNITAGATLRLRINSLNVNQAVTITGNTTGEFEDAVNTDDIDDGDELNYSLVAGTALAGRVVQVSVITSLFAAVTNTVMRYACNNFADLSDGVTTYWPIAGDGAGGNNTDEAAVRFDLNAGASYNNLFVFCSTHPGGGNSASVYVRKNGVNTTLLCLVTATGIIEDTTSATDFAADDDINYSVESFNAGAMNLEIISIEATSTDQTFHLLHSKPVSGGSQAFATSAYAPIGGHGFNATQTKMDADLKIAATLSHLTIYVPTNTITT